MFAAYLIVGNIFVAAIYIAGTGLAKMHIPAAADFTTSGQLEIQTRVDTRLQYSVDLLQSLKKSLKEEETSGKT